MTLQEQFLALPFAERRPVHFSLCDKALAVWLDYAQQKARRECLRVLLLDTAQMVRFRTHAGQHTTATGTPHRIAFPLFFRTRSHEVQLMVFAVCGSHYSPGISCLEHCGW